MNEYELRAYELVLHKYPEPEWIVIPQVRISTGYEMIYGGDRVIDFFVINMYPSEDHKCIAIEFKQSMGDFIKDVRDPLKHSAIKMYSDEFYYLLTNDLFKKVKSDAMLTSLSVKYCAGIMYVDDVADIKTYRKNHRKQPKVPFAFGFICSLVRNAKKWKDLS